MLDMLCISYDLTEEGLINEFEDVLKSISLSNLQQLVLRHGLVDY